MSKPRVSLIVSNLNGIKLNLLKDCVNSLMKPGYQNWELIVVDNASSDGSVAYLKRKFMKHKNCFIVENPVNIYSQGLNMGAEKATGKYLAYFNNDTEITKDYLKYLINEFESDKRLAIAQGKLLNYYKRNVIDSAGETMDIYGNPITIGFGEKDQKQYDKTAEILSASGSACMIKKALFKKIGGYDPDFGIGYEDMDLALRARRMGYRIKRFPKAIVYHKRAATDLAPFIKTQVKWHFNKNRITTMLKNYPPLLLIKTIPITTFLYTGIALYEWSIRRNWQIGWVRIYAMIWCLLYLPKILIKRNFTKKQSGGKFINRKELVLFSLRSLSSIIKDFTTA